MHPASFYEPMPPGTLWASVGPDGVVVFEPYPPRFLERLPILIGPAAQVRTLIRRWAKLHHDGVTYFFADLAAAAAVWDAKGALAAACRWQSFLSERLAELQAAEAAKAAAETPEPIGPGVPLA